MPLDEVRNWVFWLSLISIAAIFIHFIYWNILYIYLKKYDPILFKEPYFSVNEIAVYSSWPLGLVKVAAYIFLITNSKISKKRFANLIEPISESMTIKYLCHIWEISLFSIVVVFSLSLLWVGIDILFFYSQ